MSHTFVNSVLGILFVLIAAAVTCLMFRAWKYPYDHSAMRSEAPPWMFSLHRRLGIVYLLIYAYMMWEMVPRLWDYQIELPARTVMHLTVGMAIGAILVTKLIIVRFFKHLETKLAPFLGAALFIGSMLLTSLALPFSLREVYLSETVLDTASMTNERINRVRTQLPKAGIEDPERVARLATEESLETGRRVLTTKCTQCHDLRTVLVRPRTPMAWRQTVARMADRSTVLNPITVSDELAVTAYLIAVSPTLQQTLKQRRALQRQGKLSSEALERARRAMAQGSKTFDLDTAGRTFEANCSQCHDPEQVTQNPPETFEGVVALVQRMVGNGLMASEEELDRIIYYLTETYVPGGIEAVPDAASPSDDPASRVSSAPTGIAGGGAPLEGEALFREKRCFTCHGPKGSAPVADHIPRLAGQNRSYLVRQLEDIQSGARDNGSTNMMAGVVADLKEREIDALAAYLSGVDIIDEQKP